MWLQSLAMYVPPDEPVQETGEINMTFQADDGSHIHQGNHHPHHQHPQIPPQNAPARYEDGGVIAAVNPIYEK